MLIIDLRFCFGANESIASVSVNARVILIAILRLFPFIFVLPFLGKFNCVSYCYIGGHLIDW